MSVSRYRDVLFGIAIVSVIIFHLFESTVKGTAVHSSLKLFSHFSAAVDVFLFLSDIGLFFSFSKNQSLSHFYSRRLLRILPTFLVVAIPIYLIRCVLITHDASSFFFNLFNVSFVTSGFRMYWYVYAIILFYALFPLLYRLIYQSDRPFAVTCVIVGVTVAATILLGAISPETLHNIEIMLTRFPAFVFGIYAGNLVKDGAPLRGRQVLIIACLGLAFYFLSFTSLSGFEEANLAKRYCYSCFSIDLCIVIAVLLETFSCRAKGGVPAYLGGISLELYIMNVTVRMLVSLCTGDYFETASNVIQLAYCAIIVALTFASAVGLNKLIAPINRLLAS